jgi:hypothetical protein
MCGDPYCPSCGPAQGNYQCPTCGAWKLDGGCAFPQQCSEDEQKCLEQQYHDHLVEKIWIAEAELQGVSMLDLKKPQEWWDEVETANIEQLTKMLSNYHRA